MTGGLPHRLDPEGRIPTGPIKLVNTTHFKGIPQMYQKPGIIDKTSDREIQGFTPGDGLQQIPETTHQISQ